MAFKNIFFVGSSSAAAGTGADAWFCAGLTTSFPDITESGGTVLTDRLPCKGSKGVSACSSSCSSSSSASCSADNTKVDDDADGGVVDTAAPACKAFHVPPADSSRAVEVQLEGAGTDVREQVLVFRYRGKFHAVDHSCPHSSYPLSRGTPFDIEDFGIRLSAGLTCPKHGWSFDLFIGSGDRGNYRLKIWEVELRPVAGKESEGVAGEDPEEVEREVWVRRKKRMG